MIEGIVCGITDVCYLPDTIRDLLVIGKLISKQVLLVSGNCIDPIKEMIRVRSIRTGSSGNVCISEKMEIKLPLAALVISETEESALIAILIVLNYSI